MTSIRIYTSPGCSYCMGAKNLLASLGARYEEISLWDDPELATRLRDTYHWSTVPMIFFGDTFVGGYDDIAALHRRGLLQDKISEMSKEKK